MIMCGKITFIAVWLETCSVAQCQVESALALSQSGSFEEAENGVFQSYTLITSPLLRPITLRRYALTTFFIGIGLCPGK